jgi:antirestriction protein ArdC
MKTTNNDVYAIVTDTVCKLLEEGTVPWRKPWKGKEGQPVNATSGKHYRGVNPFMLEAARMSGGFSDHRWLTFKQAKAAGGSVRKGAKSTLVVFWKWLEKTDEETGKKQRIPLLRYYRVFNLEQCEGIDEAKLKADADKYEPTQWEAIEAAEAMASEYLDRSGLAGRIEEGGGRACYIPSEDALKMPDRDRFEHPAEFYSTLFHELAHSTGHKTRLDRFESGGFGSEPYAKEELVAEFTAAFLCGEAGIEAESIENSAAYINGWLKKLKADKRLLPSAAAAAQKAADLILDRQYDPAAAKDEAGAAAEPVTAGA